MIIKGLLGMSARNWTEAVGPGEIPAGRLLGPEVFWM